MDPIYVEHAGTYDEGVVAALWSVTSGSAVAPIGPIPYRVLPDGCLDLVLRVRPDTPASLAEPNLLISGPARTATLVAVEPSTLYLGVRFQPGQGGAALGLAASDLTGLTLSGDEARAALGTQTELLRGARSVAALRARLAALLAQQMAAAREHPPSTQACAALALIRRSRGLAPMGKIARQIGVSERTLHRSVTEAAGLSPKALSNVLRFQHALALVRHGLPLAEAAACSGFSDQAHMTRAFRSLGGFTPGAGAA